MKAPWKERARFHPRAHRYLSGNSVAAAAAAAAFGRNGRRGCHSRSRGHGLLLLGCESSSMRVVHAAFLQGGGGRPADADWGEDAISVEQTTHVLTGEVAQVITEFFCRRCGEEKKKTSTYLLSWGNLSRSLGHKELLLCLPQVSAHLRRSCRPMRARGQDRCVYASYRCVPSYK